MKLNLKQFAILVVFGVVSLLGASDAASAQGRGRDQQQAQQPRQDQRRADDQQRHGNGTGESSARDHDAPSPLNPRWSVDCEPLIRVTSHGGVAMSSL